MISATPAICRGLLTTHSQTLARLVPIPKRPQIATLVTDIIQIFFFLSPPPGGRSVSLKPTDCQKYRHLHDLSLRARSPAAPFLGATFDSECEGLFLDTKLAIIMAVLQKKIFEWFKRYVITRKHAPTVGRFICNPLFC